MKAHDNVADSKPVTAQATIADCAAEAARYALLRRIAPAIRHGIVGRLHPIALISEVIDRRLKTDAPEVAGLQESAARLLDVAQKGMRICTRLMGWVAPDDEAPLPLAQGIEECLGLLTTDFNMRGFFFDNRAGEVSLPVTQTALRTVLPAVLLAATDASSMPADILLEATQTGTHATVSISLRDNGRIASMVDSNAYRPLRWDEAALLAQVEKVQLLRQEAGAILTYRIADQ